MARSLWNGTVSIGLMHVPVKLYSAEQIKTVRFREVHLSDEAKIEHRRFCSVEEREVRYEEIVKGYQLRNGDYVILDKDELAAAAGNRGKVIELDEFVELAAVDPVFFAKTYFLGAGKGGDEAYRVLHAALARTGRAGIGRFTFHSREYLAAIRPCDDLVLALHTMRFADEVVPGDEIEFDPPGRKPRPREVEMASKLVSSLHERFDPTKRRDEYREAVLEMIERKAAGKKIEPPEEEPVEQAPDLMSALEASLGRGR